VLLPYTTAIRQQPKSQNKSLRPMR